MHESRHCDLAAGRTLHNIGRGFAQGLPFGVCPVWGGTLAPAAASGSIPSSDHT